MVINNFYFRVLEKVKCISCGHEAYDADVEQHISFEYKKGCFVGIQHMICPECGSVDKFKYLDKKE